MVRDPFVSEEIPDFDEVIGVLGDSDCKTIITNLDKPMTANELSDTCDIPLSTTYRKLDRLTESTLLEELTELRSDGHHTARYRRNFEEVQIGTDEEGELYFTIERPRRSSDERLVELWSEVKRGV